MLKIIDKCVYVMNLLISNNKSFHDLSSQIFIPEFQLRNRSIVLANFEREYSSRWIINKTENVKKRKGKWEEKNSEWDETNDN